MGLLEFYRKMFGAAANEQLCEHTFRVGAESLFRSVGAEILEAARRPDVDEAPDAAPDAGGGAEGARGAAPKRPSTCYSRMKVFDAPPAPRVADTVLWALSCDGEFRSLRPVLAAALGLHEEGVTPQSVLWCVGRAGMQELLSILPKEKLEARASRILYEWHGPHELLLETTKLHRRREEFRINGDHLDIAPEWDDLPPEPESAARTPAFCNDAFFRRPPHMVFFIARTVYRPRTFSSQFPRMWGGCHHTPTDLYRDALVHSLVELVFPSPAEIVGKWQVNNLTRDETVALDAMSDHKMQRMLHLVALDNEPADRLMAYVAEEGLRVRPGCVDEFWLSHDRALVSTEDHVLDSDPDDECRLPAYRPRRPRKRAAAEAGVG